MNLRMRKRKKTPRVRYGNSGKECWVVILVFFCDGGVLEYRTGLCMLSLVVILPGAGRGFILRVTVGCELAYLGGIMP